MKARLTKYNFGSQPDPNSQCNYCALVALDLVASSTLSQCNGAWWCWGFSSPSTPEKMQWSIPDQPVTVTAVLWRKSNWTIRGGKASSACRCSAAALEPRGRSMHSFSIRLSFIHFKDQCFVKGEGTSEYTIIFCFMATGSAAGAFAKWLC